jgi:hypothetical protein
LTEVTVASRLLGRALCRRLRGELEPPPDIDAFRAGFQALLDSVPTETFAEIKWCAFNANVPPWIDSGLNLDTGDEASYFICGRTTVAGALDIWVDPRIQVWSKVGDKGEVTRAARESHSFTAATAGPLLFGNYFPNHWADRIGRLGDSKRVYKPLRGEYLALVVRWPGSARDGLARLNATGDVDGRVASEIERIDQGDIRPRGWHYYWGVGEAEVFRDLRREDGTTCIGCHTHRDAGILQHDVEMALTPDSEISWQWRVDELPSDIREDAVPSHDYLSIAVEFDNGRDITYYWSSALPVGTGYDCPLPGWKGKEYHVVVRSGPDGLGAWHEERRNLYQDYLTYMGEPPGRIVRVWLIANSVFQRRSGTCSYAAIRVADQNRIVEVV